jgi:hypothetical protein
VESERRFPYFLSLTVIHSPISNVFNNFFLPWKAAEKKLQQQENDDDFFNALASSLLRALRNFQFLFCALSIQCRMANVAA